ncbi:hydroxymethylbilane synthase [Advenella mimigardefordensis]|uniref:Porphobilinogen deaminase n=1 Tax=Advenella mimigardefordensis (strain DSM 17166 / LMG 22922 / DPN7) TaxID=1247726 RepID=W0PEI3_ADVMD|nr:hydroxymethylbilane synthase [Advenella mimigardefordensis]AHG63912.1 porphobilinogen deaminase [Advenella mimigardefordensis DPN7]
MTELKKLTIATRASRLALWQAHHVRDLLQTRYPQLQVELLELTTKGDQILDTTLSKIGGKGLFIKELETALVDGRADLAVHSLKDVPVDLQSPFALAAVLQRADPTDAFVSSNYQQLSQLPAGAVVGTSSLRRESQIRAVYPHLVVKPLRGNLDTRLSKLDKGDYDAIVLASAGLERLGLGDRIASRLEVAESLPAAGQGALGIEVLETRAELLEILAGLADPATTACVTAERAVSRTLGGSCQVPIAAYATLTDNAVTLNALVATPDGKRVLRSTRTGGAEEADQLGVEAAQALREQGADDILAALQDPSQPPADKT